MRSTFHVRLSDLERRILERAAALLGVPISTYIRQAAMKVARAELGTPEPSRGQAVDGPGPRPPASRRAARAEARTNAYVVPVEEVSGRQSWWMLERQARGLPNGCTAEEYLRGDFGLGLGGTPR